jgi:hypothetical protein
MKKVIIAIAHNLLKIAYQILQTRQPYTDLGADSCLGRESHEQQHAYRERRPRKLRIGRTATVTISPRRAAHARRRCGGRLTDPALSRP